MDCLSFRNEISEVSRLEQWLEEALSAAGVNMASVTGINLALEEIMVNIINYAYPGGTQGIGTLDFYKGDGSLVFVFTDSGVPFDPTMTSSPDTSLSAEERPIGGLGIYLVRQIMDELHYERTQDGKNVLKLIKKY